MSDSFSPFEFGTASRILFGSGSIQGLPEVVKPFGSRLLLVVSPRGEAQFQSGIAKLKSAGLSLDIFLASGEPSFDVVHQGVELARSSRSQVVVALGGGSVIDTGKAIAGLATHDGSILEYLEVVGGGKPLTNPTLPFIAVPTTAGAGAEVTRNAVLSVPSHQVKVSLRSSLLFPKVALVDPELTLTLPLGTTLSSGLDALTQLIEAYTTRKSNPLTDGWCRQAIPWIVKALPRLLKEPDHLPSREAMALASLYGGLALANSGLGAVHGFAAPLGGLFTAPHGAICALLLPHVMKANFSLLSERHDAFSVDRAGRYRQINEWVSPQVSQDVSASVMVIQGWLKQMRTKGLRSFGVEESHLEKVAEAAASASSMKGNPVDLSQSQKIDILRAAL